MTRPPLPEVESAWEAGQSMVLAQPLAGHVDFIRLLESWRGRRHRFLLHSAKPSFATGRYSWIGCEPDRVLTARAQGGGWTLRHADGRVETGVGPVWESLRRELAKVRLAPSSLELPPFVGGAVGVVSYDLAWQMDRVRHRAKTAAPEPDLWFGFYRTVVAQDHLAGTAWALTLVTPEDGLTAAQAFAQGALCLEECRRMCKSPQAAPANCRLGPMQPDMEADAFESMVRAAQDYIAAGDIFQANLSQRFRAQAQGEPDQLYRALTAVNPSPFSAFLETDGPVVVSSSPERLVKRVGRLVQTRPIAGTRPRGRDLLQDERLSTQLLLNEKERAEHIMLVDLERNDLGRVCEYGSVQVNGLMMVEAYSHVMHIVSNIRGRLRSEADGWDVLSAMFPGGTITGTPKIRAMEIIDELEPGRRGFYTGSLGYFSWNGAVDFNILIRTFIWNDDHVVVQAGAGIVADSDPAREYDETIFKAKALFEAAKRVKERTAYGVRRMA